MNRRCFLIIYTGLVLGAPYLLRPAPTSVHPIVCPAASRTPSGIHRSVPARGTYAGWPQPGVPPQPPLLV